MEWRKTQVDLKSTPRIPLGNTGTYLEHVLQCLDRATESVNVGKLCIYVDAWEYFEAWPVLILGGQSVVLVHHILQCKWPQCKVDGLWPSTICMKQLLSCQVLEVSCGPLSNAILKMGFDATLADVLIVNFTIVSKPAVVCMVLFDSDTMTGHNFSNAAFCLHCFSQWWGLMEMEIVQAQGVVNKDGGSLISFVC